MIDLDVVVIDIVVYVIVVAVVVVAVVIVIIVAMYFNQLFKENGDRLINGNRDGRKKKRGARRRRSIGDHTMVWNKRVET